MSTNVRANIELGVNIVVAAAIVIVTVLVIRRYAFQEVPQTPRVSIGARLTVPNVDWEQNKKTLVFFLMENCVYCESSAPVYRELIEDASKHNIKSLAILPHPVEEGKKYVQRLQLPIQSVQTGSFRSYQVPGAPTVLFVDNHGTVRSVWIGAATDRQKEMQKELTGLF